MCSTKLTTAIPPTASSPSLVQLCFSGRSAMVPLEILPIMGRRITEKFAVVIFLLGFRQIHMRKVIQDATIKIPRWPPDDHLCDHSHCHYAGDDPGARPHSGRIRKNQTAARRTRAHPHRTRYLQRDVERALLLQVVARSPETSAHT